MSNAPSILSGVGNSTQFAEPRTALCEFIAEVRRDLEAGHSRLSSSESVEQLVAAATQTHKAPDRSRADLRRIRSDGSELATVRRRVIGQPPAPLPSTGRFINFRRVNCRRESYTR